jgi:aspartate/tyrosine/aromatic aminotransferase
LFETVKDYPVDPIMIGMELFAQDPRKDKLNLTVGIYEDDEGKTPILSAVKQAEQKLVESQPTKSYTFLTGDVEYCETLGKEIFGSSRYNQNRWVSAQTAGGAVALRVMADLFAQMPNQPTIWMQSPSYGNYIPILTAAGASFDFVPYYDSIQREIQFQKMLNGLEAAKPGDVFLMQGVCHNPTGADLSLEQFDLLLDTLASKGILPWLDLAYLGFGQSFEADCEMARRIAERFEELVICITLSKSFGIYRDRAGALFVKTKEQDRTRIHQAISGIIRPGASHAPDHGPSVVRLILQDPDLKELWLQELDAMRQRVATIRKDIAQIEREQFGRDDLAYLAHQSGMFSLLALTPEQEARLTQDHGIHVVKGGRVNVARLKQSDIPTLIKAYHSVIDQDAS